MIRFVYRNSNSRARVVERNDAIATNKQAYIHVAYGVSRGACKNFSEENLGDFHDSHLCFEDFKFVLFSNH